MADDEVGTSHRMSWTNQSQGNKVKSSASHREDGWGQTCAAAFFCLSVEWDLRLGIGKASFEEWGGT